MTFTFENDLENRRINRRLKFEIFLFVVVSKWNRRIRSTKTSNVFFSS